MPKEVSLVTYNKDNTPILELPNDENKLFDEGDDIGNSTIPDLSLPGEEDEEETTIINVGNMPLITCFNYLHPMLKERV